MALKFIKMVVFAYARDIRNEFRRLALLHGPLPYTVSNPAPPRPEWTIANITPSQLRDALRTGWLDYKLSWKLTFDPNFVPPVGFNVKEKGVYDVDRMYAPKPRIPVAPGKRPLTEDEVRALEAMYAPKPTASAEEDRRETKKQTFEISPDDPVYQSMYAPKEASSSAPEADGADRELQGRLDTRFHWWGTVKGVLLGKLQDFNGVLKEFNTGFQEGKAEDPKGNVDQVKALATSAVGSLRARGAKASEDPYAERKTSVEVVRTQMEMSPGENQTGEVKISQVSVKMEDVPKDPHTSPKGS